MGKLKREKNSNILEIAEDISHIKDIDSLLDRILLEVRHFTNADAGSIYLVKENRLAFEYVQNDTLMKDSSSGNKYLYVKREMEINTLSIAGYVTLKREPLIIDDVYNISSRLPYSFNRSFDELSSYRTQSVLTVPLKTSRDKVVGVMQIINKQNIKKEIIPFSEEDELYVTLFANQAAVAIERAIMTREMVLRMVKIAQLRDPKETGNHVNRVGAYSIEIYKRWAMYHGVSGEEVQRVKDILRIAAMLHDVGKVAISDQILRKGSRLSEDEYDHMKRHTIYGARLFSASTSDWDDMAASIALNHHEKWDGTGYPGRIDDISDNNIVFGPGKRGEEIPLVGRIVAMADVYDALISQRGYKSSWPEERVLEYMGKEKGRHFDPDVVEAFFSIYDVIKAVLGKFSD
jgi:response regulator RpfG family c-di-GMP phosphodiesterase